MGVLPLRRGGVGYDGAPGSFSSGLEAAPGWVSNVLVHRGKWSFPLWPMSLRLGEGWGGGGWGVGGEPDWGKCQPVGSFEMEVTSSGLKKNCQASPPQAWAGPWVPFTGHQAPLPQGHNLA